MNYPKMWCMENKNQKLIIETLRKTKGESVDALFDCMPASFREKHWKKPLETRMSYLELGYRAVKVVILPAGK